MCAAPAKRKPIVFKRRAGPSAAPPAIIDSDSASESDPSTFPRAATTETDGSGGGGSAGRAGVDLFRRAKQFFPRAIEEQGKRAQEEKKRIEKLRVDAAATSTTQRAEADDHSTKRRKVSPEATGDADRPDTCAARSPRAQQRSRSTASPPPLTSPLHSPRRPAAAGNKGKGVATQHTVNAGVVFADEDEVKGEDEEVDERAEIEAEMIKIKEEAAAAEDDECKIVEERPVVQETRKADDMEDDDGNSDEVNPEFSEYILRARALDAAARAARQASEPAAAAAASTTGLSQVTTVSSTGSTPVLAPATEQHYRLFITAHFGQEVPPLIVTLRMDQKIAIVQEAFVDNMRKRGIELPADMAEKTVLTWKGVKIYSWTTGQTLDIHPDAHGKFRDELGLHQPSGFLSGGLHLEIWTQELYEQHCRDQERRRQRILGEGGGLDDDDDLEGEEGGAGAGDVSGSDDEAAKPVASQRIRLVLRSRDYDKLNMTVHADTRVEALVTAFREQRKIAPDKTIAIHWDGERLDEETTVEEAEMEDMDSVEVFIY